MPELMTTSPAKCKKDLSILTFWKHFGHITIVCSEKIMDYNFLFIGIILNRFPTLRSKSYPDEICLFLD